MISVEGRKEEHQLQHGHDCNNNDDNDNEITNDKYR